MVTRTLAAALALAFALPGTAAAQGGFGTPALPAPDYDAPIKTSFYHELRDGVKVAVDLYRPARNGKPVDGRFPVIWTHDFDRTPRAPDAASKVEGGELGLGSVPALARYGYVVARIERRGFAASFGTRRGYHDRNEAHDAYELTEWLAAQDWSDGKVGIYGCSNTGDSTMHAVTVAPPHLKAAFAGCFSWNKYDAMMRGGLLAQWGTGPTRTREEEMRATPVDGDADRKLLARAVEDHQKAAPLLEIWTSIPYRDGYAPSVASRFWYEGSASSYMEQIRRSGIPVYILAGWQDDFRKEGLVAFNNLPDGKRRYLIGDWRHCRNDGFNLLAEMKRFFDAELKAGPALVDPPIHYYTVHAPAGTEWRAADRWPLASATMQALALSTRGALVGGAGRSGRVNVSYAAPRCPDLPNNQPPGSSAGWVPCPDPAVASRFDTAPARTDTEITGHPLAELTVVPTAADADVFVYLQDVAPDGKVETITDGRLRLSLAETGKAPYDTMGLPWRRAFAEDAKATMPGKPMKVAIDMLPISWNIRAGHRLRLLATASDYRERRPEEGGGAGFALVTGGTASRLVLPVIGAGKLGR